MQSSFTLHSVSSPLATVLRKPNYSQVQTSHVVISNVNSKMSEQKVILRKIMLNIKRDGCIIDSLGTR